MTGKVVVDVDVGESYVIVRVVACPFDDVVIVVNHAGAGASEGLRQLNEKRLSVKYGQERKGGARTACSTSCQEGKGSEQHHVGRRDTSWSWINVYERNKTYFI